MLVKENPHRRYSSYIYILAWVFWDIALKTTNNQGALKWKTVSVASAVRADSHAPLWLIDWINLL